MMGHHARSEALFYYFCLEDQVPENHLLRLIDKHISFEFVRKQLKDSYSETGRPSILKRHPRFVSHFVPTSSSWLNLVERWFGELTSKRIRRGSLRSVEDLEKAITEFLAAWNENPRPRVHSSILFLPLVSHAYVDYQPNHHPVHF